MITRGITSRILAALSDTPVVFLNGPRQAGKTTLVRSLAAGGFGGSDDVSYMTFDKITTEAGALSDPEGFVSSFSGPAVIDEAQRVPELFRAIKLRVDENRRPGLFLLTGSANVLTVPGITESLAGRMEIVTLHPFSQGEIRGRTEHFVDACFGDALPAIERTNAPVDYSALAHAGGYPEAIERTTHERRRGWFDAYVSTILQRDIRDLANIEGLTELPNLLSLVATRSGGLVNYAELSRTSGLAASTLKRYLSLLRMTFLVRELPAWSRNQSKRLVRSPKMYLNDPGLASYLLDSEPGTPGATTRTWGPLLETFVLAELTRQTGWSRSAPRLYHYRTSNGSEVDVVMESSRGEIAGIEVKASASVVSRDFNGLRSLREDVGSQFRRGIVLYSGSDLVYFENDLVAVPLRCLWEW